jgi:hypothetical protein
MPDLYELAKDLAFNRYPIKVRISVVGVDVPTVQVAITNETPSTDVYIHVVRVHYGNKIFSRAFTLLPAEKIFIKAKDRAEWALSFEKAILTERVTQKGPPAVPNRNEQPGIDSPAQLFNAIGMGQPEHSWIEIDFNEYSNREFLRGQVKSAFDTVGKLHRELRLRRRADPNGGQHENGS